ncbi:tyrosine-type recombinase/integrase [Aquirufa regiilacus]|uniref:Tyrosine recombinase XerC n=1 Tax=Aquirufa regiilacus TaxID=3024868 RepID=A0ABU3TPZ7_9BACT|nr:MULTISPECIES: tyrosine-type recombinase/integrase [unclassified Aquirufa]MDT8887392.1 tyrosine-type recombinase/integrase [Aquirufa sp. LEPPI-3A]MDU0807935.1 tyrosine-type recombinase/integrase [Aquirufa sp. LEOWEIH-7C]
MNREVVNFFLQHLQVERRLSPLTLRSYEIDLIQFLDFLALDSHQITQIKAQTIRLWLVELSNIGIQNRSINRKLATLRTFFKYLQRRGDVTDNPMQTIRMVKTSKSLPTYLRESEMEQVFAQQEIPKNTFEEVRDQLVLMLLYGTGMRLAELIQLSNQQLNLASKTLRVIGKRNKERIIPMPQLLVDLVKQYQSLNPFQSHSLLLTDKGEPCYPMFIQRLVKKYLGEVSTLEKLSPHVLRHSYATHLLNRGADLNAIKELLGHANLAATQVYTHNSMEKLKEIYKQAHPKA